MSGVIHPYGFAPDFKGFVEWADRMSFLITAELPQFEILQPLLDEDDPDTWKNWAMGIVGDQSPLGQDSPNPWEFDEWQDWAERLFSTQDLSG